MLVCHLGTIRREKLDRQRRALRSLLSLLDGAKRDDLAASGALDTYAALLDLEKHTLLALSLVEAELRSRAATRNGGAA